ncbi:uncharacterized protein EDB91DRAFT_1082721 [Suillus paluster]|uniref:uncharacterized protein n=1 Tax=Suillus paluster TaxID=48578 RepID=UPI001B85C5FB|nr:uncharacterized protein EDB91DRAFT_1082721 [Suillus paluster]KAG1738324.1 hypothetical protein EDB91DRAFT_1082721 [Suillus paluster]
MSTPAETSFAELKAITRQIVDIVRAARLLPPGNSHLALKAQVTELVAKAVWDHEASPCIPGIVLSCSKELLRVRQLSPQDSPNWHSIGHNNLHLQRHSWRHKVSAWEALGDRTFDLPVDAPKSPDTVAVDLPSPPAVAGSIAGPSSSTIDESREKHEDKGKGKALDADPEPEADGSRERKSPLISGPSCQPLKSVMKSRKRAKSARVVKSAEFVESKDEPVDKPAAKGGPVILLHRLTSVLPRIPKKRPFSLVKVIAGRRADVAGQTDSTSNTPVVTPVVAPTVIDGPAGSPPEVIEHSDSASNTPAVTPDLAPTVIDTDDILIPGPNNPCWACNNAELPCTTRFNNRTGKGLLSCVFCNTKKVKCFSVTLGSPPKRSWGKSTTRKARSRTPSKAPSTSQPKARTRSQSRGVAGAVKAPAPPPTPSPAPAPIASSSARVPRAALDVPMPDLHSMARSIRDSAERIKALEDLVAEQGSHIDTLSRLHESLRRQTMEPHPSFPLPTTPAIATSLLLDQSIAGTTSPSQSALPPLIDISIAVEPTPSKIEDRSAIEGLSFELSQVQPAPDLSPTPSTAGAILVPDDPRNLVPEYDSGDEMDVEVKVEVEGGDEGHLVKVEGEGDDEGHLGENEIEFRVTNTDVQVTDIDIRVTSIDIRATGIEFWASSTKFRAANTDIRCEVPSSEFRASSSKVRASSSKYRVPRSGHRVPSSGHQVVFRCSMPGTRCLDLGTRYSELNAWTSELDARNSELVLNAWNSELDAWTSELDARTLELGTRSFVQFKTSLELHISYPDVNISYLDVDGCYPDIGVSYPDIRISYPELGTRY